MALVRSHLWATLEIAFAAFCVAAVVAVPLGVLAATWPQSLCDQAVMTLTLIGQSAPTFWIGIMLILAFGLELRWFPIGGRGTAAHLVMPALTLGAFAMASIARLTRSAMLEVMREDYLRTARAKGMREMTVIGRHALKNALLPVVTVSGYQFGRLLGGVIIVESIFVVPGMGTLLIDSIVHRDFIVIQAVVLLIAAVVLTLNLVIDLLYGVLDPRIRYQ